MLSTLFFCNGKRVLSLHKYGDNLLKIRELLKGLTVQPDLAHLMHVGSSGRGLRIRGCETAILVPSPSHGFEASLPGSHTSVWWARPVEETNFQEDIVLITIPTQDDRGLAAEVASHFGRSEFFTTVDTETEEVITHQNQGHHFGGPQNPATTAAKAGTDAIACAGLGRKALQYFRAQGIEVYVGAEGTVQKVLTAFQDGKLARASEEDACPGRHSEQSC